MLGIDFENKYGEALYPEMVFPNIVAALYYAKKDLGEETFNDMFPESYIGKKDLSVMEKYIVTDWTNKIMYNGAIFDDEDDTIEFINSNEDDLEDLEVIMLADYKGNYSFVQGATRVLSY